MPRAHRYHLPGHVWHLTHRCHRRDFLLKFARDRRDWVQWLFEARKRFGLCVLNYQVTSNHIHLVVLDRDRGEIADSMQLIEGCTGAAYNARKKRTGAYWQDRYSATAVETGTHLWRCLVYVDLNMVRAGAVDHPADWPHAGYHEILVPRQRYRIIDRRALCQVLEIGDVGELPGLYADAVRDALMLGSERDERWTRSVAVGSRNYVERVATELGSRGVYRKIHELGDDAFILREPDAAYGCILDTEMGGLTAESASGWSVNRV